MMSFYPIYFNISDTEDWYFTAAANANWECCHCDIMPCPSFIRFFKLSTERLAALLELLDEKMELRQRR